MSKIPVKLEESDLVDLLTARVSASDAAEDTARWQARLMLHVGDLLAICRQVAAAPCVFAGHGSYVVSVPQHTRRKAREILQQLERRTERQPSEDLPIHVISA
jgi:hypothetical protein